MVAPASVSGERREEGKALFCSFGDKPIKCWSNNAAPKRRTSEEDHRDNCPFLWLFLSFFLDLKVCTQSGLEWVDPDVQKLWPPFK